MLRMYGSQLTLYCCTVSCHCFVFFFTQILIILKAGISSLYRTAKRWQYDQFPQWKKNRLLIDLNSNVSRVEISLDNKSKIPHPYGFPCGAAVKNPPAHSGDMGLIPGSGRSPGVGNGNPLQYPCLRNPMNRRSLACYSPWGRKRVGHDLATEQKPTHPLDLFNMRINYTFLEVHYRHVSAK